MAEQIMWIVKDAGFGVVWTIGHSEYSAKCKAQNLTGLAWDELESEGYRCIRVKVTEVEDVR